MALYTLKSRDEALLPLANYSGDNTWVRNQMSSLGFMPTAAETQVYSALGRTTGAEGNGGSNFFEKRGRSIENALGTTGASIVAGVNDRIENAKTDQMRKDNKQSMNDIAKKYGYNSWSDWQDANAAARESNDTEAIKLFDEQLKEFQAQANANANKATEKAKSYNDYRQNDYISQKVNQDRGKFAGSAINTLSTAVDVTGLGANPLSNAVQGGIEGLADELEENGLQDFSWERAGQNALIGATTGAVTGAVNAGVSGALAKRAAAKGLTNTAVKSGVGSAIKNGAKTIATGAARGALSGAVGGATGAGLQSALNGVEFGQGVQNALQGGIQGAKQGAVTGATMAGANMAISKTPGVGKFYNELQGAKQKWDQSGSNFDERLTNTLTSGDSAVGDWLMNKRQSNVLGTAGNLGNKIQFDEDGNLVLYRGQKGLDDLYYNSDQEKGTANLEGAFFMTPDEEQAAAFGDDIVKLKLTPEQQKQFFLSKEQYAKLTDDAAKQVSDYDYMDRLYQSDPEAAERIETMALGRPNDVAKLSNKPIVQNDATDIDEMFVYKGINPEFDELVKSQLAQPTTAKGWAKKAGQRIVEDLNNTNLGNRVQDVSGADAWDRLAQQNGYQDWSALEQSFMAANPNYKPTGYDAGAVLSWMDQNSGTPTTAAGWAKRAGQRAIEDISNSNIGMRVQDVSQDMPEDISNMKINDYNANADGGLGERIKNNLRSPDSRAGNILKNMPGKLGDKYNDWLAEPAQIDEFGPRYSQFSGNPEAARDYLMRRQQGEVPRASYNQSLQDVNGDGFVDYVYGKSGDGNKYSSGYGLSHIAEKHGDEALARVPYNTENGIAEKQPYGRYYLTNDQNDDLTVVRDYWQKDKNSPQIKKQWLATSFEPDNLASKGTTASGSPITETSVGSDAGDAPAKSIVPQNDRNVNSNPQTQVYEALTGNKTDKASKLRYAAGLKLAAQYGTIDKPTAKATNPAKTFTELNELGFTKPADVERMAGAMTGSNGEMSALVRNVVQAADPIDTFAGEKTGQTLDDYINASIQKHGLDGINEGKAVKSQVNALMKSLPSHAEGSITFKDDPESVFKLTQQLDAEAANYRGKSGMNYGTTTPDKLRAAQVIGDVSDLLKNRIYSTTDVEQALTPEVAQNLKAYAPNNKAWADYVDNTVMKMENVKDLRSAQANWVNANKIIDNAYTNSMTYGGRVGGGGSTIPLTKRGIAGAILDKTINSGPGLRTQAKVLNKAADIVDKTPKTTDVKVDTTVTPENAVVASPAELANMTANYNPSTQLYNAIGRTEGLTNAEQKNTANYLADAAQEAEVVAPMEYATTPTTNIATSANNGSTALYDTLNGTQTATNNMGNTTSTVSNTGYFQPTGDYWTDIIASAMSSAIDAEDVAAFTTLYSMYQDALSNASKSKSSSGKDYSDPTNWNSSDRSKLLAAQNGLDQIDQLENAYVNATGESGGNLAQGWLRSRAADLSGGNWDPSAANYNNLADSVGMGIIKNLINLGVTESDAERYKKYLPALTDTKEQAEEKLATLRSIYQSQINNLYSVYGV